MITSTFICLTSLCYCQIGLGIVIFTHTLLFYLYTEKNARAFWRYSMLTAGIVAEYNPFHNGHEAHIEATRGRAGAGYGHNLLHVGRLCPARRARPVVEICSCRGRRALRRGPGVLSCPCSGRSRAPRALHAEPWACSTAWASWITSPSAASAAAWSRLNASPRPC